MLCLCYVFCYASNPRKQPTLRDVTTGFPGKWRLRDDRRNSLLMTRHKDFWLVLPRGKFACTNQKHHQIWVVTRHQYGISALRRLLAGKPALASRNVECFLRLLLYMCANLIFFFNESVPPSLLPQCHVTPLPPRWPLSVESFDRIFFAGMTYIISKLTERLSVSLLFSRSFSGNTLEFSPMKRLILQIGQTPVCKSSRERHFVEAAVGWAGWICWP